MNPINLKIKELSGYTPSKAFEGFTDFSPNAVLASNCTPTWHKRGCPKPGTDKFKSFCLEMLMKKTKCTPGLGCYITLGNYKDDMRDKPIKIIKSSNTKGIKKYEKRVTIYEAVLDTTDATKEPEIISVGSPIASFNTYEKAAKAIRTIAKQTKKDYIIQTEKVPVNPILGYGVYTPSKNAQEGTFIVFGVPFA
jgi:hypothetical protein